MTAAPHATVPDATVEDVQGAEFRRDTMAQRSAYAALADDLASAREYALQMLDLDTQVAQTRALWMNAVRRRRGLRAGAPALPPPVA